MNKIALFLISVFFAACANLQLVYSIDLKGEWKIKLDTQDVGISEKWFTHTFDRSITLPGSLQEQGYGNDVDIHTEWTGQIVDRSWYDAPEYKKFRQPGNMKVPFWLNPEKHYVGVAWYQKTITVPSDWKGKTILLELERPHWETTLYLDDKKIGEEDGLSTPHRYLLENVSPGKHTLTVRVDNRINIPVGVNAHSVSDHTQSNWNGIVGNLSISPKSKVYLETVEIYPDIQSKNVEVKVHLKSPYYRKKGTLQLQMETLNGEPIGTSVQLDFKANQKDIYLTTTVTGGNNVKLWSEYTPNLYCLKTTVMAGKEKEEQYTNFGFREFKKVGTRFHVNNQPVFLRGTLECCIFPLTGYPAMNSQYWEKIYRTCQEFGLNHVRFHSWCPPEVAFDVADRMGIYLQVECAGWATVGDGGYVDEWFYKEGDRILKEYGNHPSFCMLVYGNEPGGANQVSYLSGLVEYWKGKDNRRVYTSGAGWPYVENADYWNAPDPRIQAWGGGLKSIMNAQPPRLDYDFREIIKKDMPTVSHEIGQWCVYPNFQEIDKYTGVLKAKNFEIFKETLNDSHLGDLADQFLYASGKLQTLCYKSDIEAALRTPGFAGFQLLDLHDFPGQGTALVGVLDPFWDTKGYVDGNEFSMFCNQTVPVVRFPKMIWQNNEQMNLPVEFSHFGKEPLKNVNIVWKVSTKDNQVIGKGNFIKDLPLDNCIPVGSINLSLASVTEPTQLVVSVEVENSAIKNQWNTWVYPVQKPVVSNQPYITSQLDKAAIDRLNKGESVLLISPKGNIAPEKGGEVAVGFTSIFWNTAWTRNQAPHTLGILCDPKHPVFASFPTEGYSDFQWWDLVSECDAMIMNDFPSDFRPIVHLIDDWFKNRKLGILFEAKVGKGKLMVCSADLINSLENRPAAAQFRQSVLEYMTSDKFNPQTEINPELISGLFVNQ